MERTVEAALFILNVNYGTNPSIKDKARGLVRHDRFLTGRKQVKEPSK